LAIHAKARTHATEILKRGSNVNGKIRIQAIKEYRSFVRVRSGVCGLAEAAKLVNAIIKDENLVLDENLNLKF